MVNDFPIQNQIELQKDINFYLEKFSHRKKFGDTPFELQIHLGVLEVLNWGSMPGKLNLRKIDRWYDLYTLDDNRLIFNPTSGPEEVDKFLTRYERKNRQISIMIV